MTYLLFHDHGVTQVEVISCWDGHMIRRYTDLDVTGRAIGEPRTVTEPIEPPVAVAFRGEIDSRIEQVEG